MALDFTFLNEDQIWGDDSLEVMKRYGTKVAPTDLTLILGGYMIGCDDRTSEGDLSCTSWSASSTESGYVRCADYNGDEYWHKPNRREVSARPALPPSEASKISPSESRVLSGIRVAEYGEYPQTVADERTSAKLERLRGSRSLRPTGKNYTFDSVDPTDWDTPFKATSYQEYEMDGKRYIRVPGRPADDYYYYSKLSTGARVEKGKTYWIEVQPIEWLMDRSGTMVAKKCLFAGIQFDTNERYDGDFSKTSMKHYFDTYFAKEMEPTGRVASRTVAKIYKGSTERKGLNNILKALDENMKPTQLRQRKKREFVAEYRKNNPKSKEGLNNILKALDENMEPTQSRQMIKRKIVEEYRKKHPKSKGSR